MYVVRVTLVVIHELGEIRNLVVSRVIKLYNVPVSGVIDVVNLGVININLSIITTTVRLVIAPV